jgi:hypothetical protein
VARQLREMGFDARALAGGYRAWSQAYEVEPLSPTAAPPDPASTAQA